MEEDLTKLRPRTKILTGHKYGRLTVDSFSHYEIRRYKKYPEYHSYWNCTCECGNKKIAHGKSLTKGDLNSCGCLAFEARQKLGKTITATSHRKIPIKQAAMNEIIRSYVGHAKDLSKEFLLTTEDVAKLIESACHYCGCAPSRLKKYQTKFDSIEFYYNGIDRKNNNEGYTKENCLPCCTRCNIQKREMQYNDFLDHVKNIAENLKLL